MELYSKELLAKICMKAVEMNEKADKVSLALCTAEKILVNNSVGLEVWLSNTDTEVDFTIGFAKVGGKWCLALKSKENEEPRALKECGKLDRIRCAAYLPALLEEIKRHIDIILECK